MPFGDGRPLYHELSHVHCNRCFQRSESMWKHTVSNSNQRSRKCCCHWTDAVLLSGWRRRNTSPARLLNRLQWAEWSRQLWKSVCRKSNAENCNIFSVWWKWWNNVAIGLRPKLVTANAMMARVTLWINLMYSATFSSNPISRVMLLYSERFEISFNLANNFNASTVHLLAFSNMNNVKLPSNLYTFRWGCKGKKGVLEIVLLYLYMPCSLLFNCSPVHKQNRVSATTSRFPRNTDGRYTQQLHQQHTSIHANASDVMPPIKGLQQTAKQNRYNQSRFVRIEMGPVSTSFWWSDVSLLQPRNGVQSILMFFGVVCIADLRQKLSVDGSRTQTVESNPVTAEIFLFLEKMHFNQHRFQAWNVGLPSTSYSCHWTIC